MPVEAVPGAMPVSSSEIWAARMRKTLADKVNELRPFDAVIHNAAVYQAPGSNFPVNVLGPIHPDLPIERPERLVYMSSGMHLGGSQSSTASRRSEPRSPTRIRSSTC